MRNNFKFSIFNVVIFNSLQNDWEKVLRQFGDKDQKIQNLEALLQESKENISFLEKEREDFMQKLRLVKERLLFLISCRKKTIYYRNK